MKVEQKRKEILNNISDAIGRVERKKEILNNISDAIWRVERNLDDINISLNLTSGDYPTDEHWAREIKFKSNTIIYVATKIIEAANDMGQAANELRDNFFAEERKKKQAEEKT